MTKFDEIIQTPIGYLGIQLFENQLTQIQFLSSPLSSPKNQPSLFKIELDHYFQNPKHSFNIPLHLQGTPFQLKVWEALRRIPASQTMTYLALAQQLKTSPRAIGNACRANPIPLVIPCHRVIAKNHLGGYAGSLNGKLMDIKKWLLKHEAI